MFRLSFFSLTLAILVGICCDLSVAQFPRDPKPCRYGDRSCMRRLINYLLHERNQGNSTINLQELDPLYVPHVRLQQGGNTRVQLDLEFKKNVMLGFRDAYAYEVRGFGKDLTQWHELHLYFGTITLVGAYKLAGVILGEHIAGHGYSNVTLRNTEFIFRFSGTPLKKQDDTYMQIENLKLNIRARRLHIHFSNLYDGDVQRGTRANAFLNQKEREIFAEVQKTVQLEFAKVYQSAFNKILLTFPYASLFRD